ncbi:tetratricopeptide repeat protein [Candidatus Dependentiae bacterium]|nr:tetratricopeptide repeat protein [Candidatus Dependentiae bacterium]
MSVSKTNSQPDRYTKSALSWWHYLVPPCVLSLITAAFYYPSLHYSFQFDDIANITKHFSIRHNTLQSLFFTGTRWISYWLNAIHYQIGGFDPFSYRVGDLIIHSINGVLLFFLLMAVLTRTRTQHFFAQHALHIAFLTAGLFLLHPVQTQTVSYVIQGQLEGLALMAILSMALCFIHAVYTSNMVMKSAYICGLFTCAILACGTKEIAIIAPILLSLIDWFFVAQGDWHSFKKRLLLHGTLMLLMGGIYAWFLKPTFFTEILGLQKVAKNNIGNVITAQPNDPITPYLFFISQFKVILHYLWIFVWPFFISVEYDWVLSSSFFALDSFLPFLGLLAIGLFVLRLFKQNKVSPLVFGFLWFFLAILPRSSIIPSPELLVDYKTYTASCGWLLVLATGIVYLMTLLTGSIRQPLFVRFSRFAIIPACVLLLGFGTMQRNLVWRSGMEFWANMIQNAPNKARAYNNYGVELSQSLRKFDEAVGYFKKAISMDKNYPDPWNNLAVAYANLGNVDAAIGALKEGIKINPYYPEGYNNIASFYLQKGEIDHAEKALNTALKLRPYYGKAHYNLGKLYTQKNEPEKAWECFKNACIKGDFDNEHGFATYGRASLELKKFDDAIFAFEKTLKLNPNYPGILFNLGNAHFMAKNYDQAISCYKKSTADGLHTTQALFNLGETYYAMNDYKTALTWFEKLDASKTNLPQLYVRRAQCLERLGKIDLARSLLNELMQLDFGNNHPGVDKIKEGARVMLAQLNAIKIKTS